MPRRQSETHKASELFLSTQPYRRQSERRSTQTSERSNATALDYTAPKSRKKAHRSKGKIIPESRTSEVASLPNTNDVYPAPDILVPDSADEDDIEETLRTRKDTREAANDAIILQCVGQIDNGAVHLVQNSNETKELAETLLEIPASEDEGSQSSLEEIAQPPLQHLGASTKEAGEVRAPTSPKNTDPTSEEQPHLSLTTCFAIDESSNIQISSDRARGIEDTASTIRATSPENASEIRLKDGELRDHSDPLLDSITTSYEIPKEVLPFVGAVRSYPLRARTFQQQKPYTADKQQHARLIRGRVAPERFHAGKYSKDNDDDSEYEEEDDHLLAPNVAQSLDVMHDDPPTDAETVFHTIHGEMFSREFDNDRLWDSDSGDPQQLRKQPLTKSTERGVSRSLLKVRLHPQLNPRTKRKLERLVNQSVEPLEPIDAIPEGTRFPEYGQNVAYVLDDGYPSPSEQQQHVSTREDQDNNSDHDKSASEQSTSHYEPQTKKARRHRQHVLPAAFFKKNLLPDDAGTLRSLRSKEWNSRKGLHEPLERPLELDRQDHAHHAKTRLVTSQRDGDALNSFMAQLAEDGDESDEDLLDKVDVFEETTTDPRPVRKTPSYSRESLIDRLVVRSSGRKSPRPILTDTEASEEYVSRGAEPGNPSRRPRSRIQTSKWTSRNQPLEYNSSNIDYSGASSDSSDIPEGVRPDGNIGTAKKRRWTTNYNSSAFPTHLDESGADSDFMDAESYYEGLDPQHLRQYANRNNLASNNQMQSTKARPREMRNRPQRNRTIYRSRVIPVNRRRPRQWTPRPDVQQKLGGSSLRVQRQPRPAPKAKSITIQSQLTEWSQSMSGPSRPQLVNKPVFVPQHNTKKTHRPADTSLDPYLIQVSNLNAEDGNSIDTIPEQPWEDFQGDFHPGPDTATSEQTRDTVPKTSSSITKPIITTNRVKPSGDKDLDLQSGTSIPGGLYFSRDTYIGQGMLSVILKAMNMETTGPSISSRLIPDIVIFDRPLRLESDNLAWIKQELDSTIAEFTKRLPALDLGLHTVCTLDQLRGAKRCRNECLHALEGITRLIVKLITDRSQEQLAESWDVLKSVVVVPLTEIAEGLKDSKYSSLRWSLNMWIWWSIVAWNAMIHKYIADENCPLHKAAESLMSLLVEASDTHLLQQVAQMEEVTRRSQGAIYDQELIEVWVCFIQVLDRLEHGQSLPSFWSLFNSQITQLHAKVTDSGSKGCDLVDGDRASHYLTLMICLCRLHQFETDGSSNKTIQAPENWDLVLWALQKGWLSSLLPDQSSDERQFRWLLTFIHNRIQAWGWEPNVDVLTHIFKLFAGRDFRDMPTEPGFRLPEFLKRMITETALHEPIPTDNDGNAVPSRTGYHSNMAYAETLDSHDRCFEIALKVLAITLRYQVGRINQGDCLSGSEPHTPSATSQSSKLVTTPNLASPFHLLSRFEQIKVCKRLLSSLSPVIVATFSANSSDRSYSSLCNPCNLVLIIALLVPDSIRPSTVGQLRSLLNFDESDDASRRILLESVFYLGLIWQSQKGHQEMMAPQGRSLESILDYLFDRLSFLGSLVEVNARSTGDETGYTRRRDRRSPVSSLIETVLSYIHRLLLNGVKIASSTAERYPPIPFLDERLGQFLNIGTLYPSEIRLCALGVVENFLALRKRCLSDYRAETTDINSETQPEAPNTAVVDQHRNGSHLKDSADDGFSSLEFDQFTFDENDFTDLSQLSESTFPEERDQQPVVTETSSRRTNTLRTLPQDDTLVEVLQMWVYPKLEALINEHQQSVHEEQQKQAMSTIPGGLAQGPLGFKTSPNQSRHMVDPVSRNKFMFSDSMSQHGIRRIINAFADCCLVIIQQGRATFTQVSSIFKRETWHSPWLQHCRLLDELLWATHIAESSPWMVHEQEDWFLNIWFSTISIPAPELTVQHRLLLSILQLFPPKAEFGTSAYPNNMSSFGRSIQPPSESSLFEHLFNDLPIAHQDYDTLMRPADVMSQPNELIGQTLQDTGKDIKLLHEFKEARLQILARVLSNIGNHYLKVRPSAGAANQSALDKSHLLKSRYQNYLGIILNQIKRDYERLNARQMVRENLQHVKLAHHVVGHVIQHCGILLQGSQLTGTHHSVLNFLTSSRMFPQPQMDGVYVHQKIRGYAYLFHAGERHFFHDLLDTVMNHLKLVRGMDNSQFTLDQGNEYSTRPNVSKSLDVVSKGQDSNTLGINVLITDRETVVYRYPLPATDNDMIVNGSKAPVQGKDTSNLLITATSRTMLGSLASIDNRTNTKASIQTLVANQHIKDLKMNHQDSLWVLTSSLRNSALETENKKQWNHVLSSFRTMTFVSIFGPLLTAFLDPSIRDTGPSMVGFSNDTNVVVGHRSYLMTLAIPAARWLTSLIDVLNTELSFMTDYTKRSSGTLPTPLVLVAYDQLQKETSTLFYPLVRCLSGSYEIAHSSWLDRMRECLYQSQHRDTLNNPQVLTPSEEDKGAARALYVFGQALYVIEALCRTTRKLQTEQTKFYNQNSAWRDAYLELAQFAMDHGLLLLRRLGNRPTGGTGEENQDTLLVDGERQPARDRVGDAFMLEHALLEDRISGATDVVSLESSFSEFLSGQGHLHSLTEMVRSHIQALSPLRESQQTPDASTWLGDPFAPEGSQKILGESSLAQGLTKQHWAVLSFLVSFLRFLRTISTLDARFHRQVQHSLSALLLSECDTNQDVSLWLELSERREGTRSPLPSSTSQTRLHWLLGQEWRQFLSGYRPSTPVCTASSLGQGYDGDIFV